MNWTNSNIISDPSDWAIRDSSRKKYVFGQLLGKGAGGEVYILRHSTTGNEFAVKIFAGSGPRMTKMRHIQDELDTIKGLKHENIVSFAGQFRRNLHTYVLMELCLTINLEDVITRHGVLSIADARGYLRQLCLAFQYLHGKQIIHHDLKSDNVLFGVNGVLKLADFGLSIQLVNNNPAGPWRGSGIATYWPPEVVGGKDVYDCLVDVWSLGCLFYEMLVGRCPFYAVGGFKQPTLALRTRIAKADYTVPESLKSEYPSAVDLLAKMLEPAKQRRPSVAALMGHEFFAEACDSEPPKKRANLGNQRCSPFDFAYEFVEAKIHAGHMASFLLAILESRKSIDISKCIRPRRNAPKDAVVPSLAPVLEIVSLKRIRQRATGYLFRLNDGTEGFHFDDETSIAFAAYGKLAQFTDGKTFRRRLFFVSDTPTYLKAKVESVLEILQKPIKKTLSARGNAPYLHPFPSVFRLEKHPGYTMALLSNGQLHLLGLGSEAVIVCPVGISITQKAGNRVKSYDGYALAKAGASPKLLIWLKRAYHVAAQLRAEDMNSA